MNNLLIDKKEAEEFLNTYINKEHIPSLYFMYESNNHYIGFYIKDNYINRKSFNEEQECVFWLENNYSSKLQESNNNLPSLKEWLTVKDFMNPNWVSPETKKYGYRRYRLYRGENINSKLRGCVYDASHDTLTFTFITPATLLDHEPGYQPLAVDPMHNFQRVANPSNNYTMMLQIVDFMIWLKDTRPEGLGAITWKEIKDVLDVAYIRVWCNCPSFHWAGKNYRSSINDASVYPTSIPDRKMRKRFGVNDLLCKHLGNLMKPQAIQFFLPQMASSAQKTLRNQGLI